MICSVPLRALKPMDAFMLEVESGNVLVGVLERVAQGGGYAQVRIAPVGKRGRHHAFRDSDGEFHEFDDSGFKRTDWSAGTLVRPILEDEDMDETLVEGAAPTSVGIKGKVAKLKDKAAASVGKGKPAGKGKQPMSEETKAKLRAKSRTKDNDCKCGCGNKTGGNFAVGHDARYYGWLKKIVAGEKDFKELPKSVQADLKDLRGVKASLAAHVKH